MNQDATFMQKLFPILTNKDVNKRTEMMAGLTTFLTMAYIIAVNPNILSEAGMPAGALVTSTCLGAAIGCFLMGLLANMPFALASGMGLNAYFAYTVVIGMGVSWHIALTAVFVEGIIFIILSLLCFLNIYISIERITYIMQKVDIKAIVKNLNKIK